VCRPHAVPFSFHTKVMQLLLMCGVHIIIIIIIMKDGYDVPAITFSVTLGGNFAPQMASANDPRGGGGRQGRRRGPPPPPRG